jgi:hypothetical protein
MSKARIKDSVDLFRRNLRPAELELFTMKTNPEERQSEKGNGDGACNQTTRTFAASIQLVTEESLIDRSKLPVPENRIEETGDGRWRGVEYQSQLPHLIGDTF